MYSTNASISRPATKTHGAVRTPLTPVLLPSPAETCKFACNNDPLRGDFRVQFRPPLTLCVSVLPFGPDRPGRADGDGWGGQDRGDTARLFRARPLDQGDRAHAFGVARDGAQGHSQPQD